MHARITHQQFRKRIRGGAIPERSGFRYAGHGILPEPQFSAVAARL
jgi:hypothetical protein